MSSEFETSLNELEIFKHERRFAGSVTQIWDAWTQEEQLLSWWGPAGMTLNITHFDFRPGGQMIYSMSSPLGTMWGKFVYQDIKAPHDLSYIVSFCTEDATPIRHPIVPLWPLEVMTVQNFSQDGDKTLIRSSSYPLRATPAEHAAFVAGHASMHMGFNATFSQLDAYLTTL